MHSIRQAPAWHNVYSKRGDGTDDIESKRTTMAKLFSVDTGQKDRSHSFKCLSDARLEDIISDQKV
jgi:hypothetical protein